MLKTAGLVALGLVALAAPGVAGAQQGYASVAGQVYMAQYDGQPRGDWYRRWRFAGYPEFRGIEDHIRREIQDGVRQDLIERDDARDLMGQLRDIQTSEAREYQVHGWNLPGDDRERLRARLDQLDRLVDQIRDEQ
jgi:hypothetical protein